MSDWPHEFLTEVREAFLAQRRLAERALEQVDDADFFRTAGAEDNSIAAIVKHVGGNLRSRWTQPFETDGEKPDRNRDREFEVEPDTREDIMRVWSTGWSAAEQTLAALQPRDLDRTLYIRGEANSLVRALHRSLAHTAQHVGQVILLAKQWRGTEWQTLSIPRGRSQEFLTKPPA